MYKKALCLTSMLAASLPVIAHAYEEETCCRPEPKWYGGFNGGVTFLSDVQYVHPDFSTAPSPDKQTYKPGVRFGGQLGYRIMRPVRIELEGSYRMNDVKEDPGATIINPSGKKGHSPNKAMAGMTNIYYDFINRTNYTPYIGTGIGMVHVTTPRSYFGSNKASDWTLGYQFMGGLAYRFIGGSRPVDGYMGYRYTSGQDAEAKINTLVHKVSFPNDTHSLEFGVRVYFN